MTFSFAILDNSIIFMNLSCSFILLYFFRILEWKEEAKLNLLWVFSYRTFKALLSKRPRSSLHVWGLDGKFFLNDRKSWQQLLYFDTIRYTRKHLVTKKNTDVLRLQLGQTTFMIPWSSPGTRIMQVIRSNLDHYCSPIQKLLILKYYYFDYC